MKGSSRRRAARVLLAILALVAVAVAAGWVWLESEGAAHRLRRWLQARSTEVLDRRVRIGELELDLVPFRLDLEDLRVADGRPGEPPFLRIERLELRIQPWALLSRRAVIDSLVLHRPVLHLDLLEGGGTNAPSPPEARGTGAFGVELNRLDVVGGRLELNHRPTRIQAELAGVALEFISDPVASMARGTGLDGGRGRIVIEDGDLRIERLTSGDAADGEGAPSGRPVATDGPGIARGTPITLTPLRLDLSFILGQEEISVDDLSVRVGDNRAVATGTIQRWERATFEVDARLELADVHEVRPLPGPGDSRGGVAYSGRVLVEGGELHLDGRVSSREATLAGLGVTDLEAGLRLSPARIEVLDIEARTLEGYARGAVVVDRGDEEAWTIDYRLEGIDLRRLTAWEPLAALRFSGTGDASGTLRWSTPWRSTLSGEGNASIRVPVSIPPADSAAANGGPATAGAGSSGSDDPSPGDAPRASPRTVPPPGAVAAPHLPLPMTAELSHSLADGVLTVRSGELRLRDTRFAAAGRLDLDGTVSLDVDLQTADLRMIDILASQIRDMVGDDDPGTPLRLGLEGDARLNGTLSGPFRDPLLQGHLRSRQLTVGGHRVGALEADVAYRRPRLHIASLEVRKDEGAVRGDGWLRLGATDEDDELPADYDVDLSLDDYRVTIDLPVDDRRLAFDGPVSGTVELRGTYDGRPRGTVDVRTRGLRLGDLPALEVAARADLSAEVWSFARLRVAPLDSEGQVVARGNWRPEGDTVDGSLDLEGLDVAWLGPVAGVGELGGRLSGEASVSGSLPLPAGTATLRWSDATLGGTGIGNLVIALHTEEGLLSVRALGAGGSGVEAAALSPPSIPPAASMDEDGIVAPTLPAGRDGLLAVAALLRLPGAVPTTATDERIVEGRAAVRLEAPPQLLSLLLEIGGVGLPPSVSVDGALVAHGEGPLGDWQAWRGRASLTNLELGLERVTLRATRPLEAELDGHVLSVRMPSLGTEHGTMSLRAVLDLAAGRWREAEISGDIDLAVARLWQPDWRVSGFGRGSVRLSGALNEPEVRGALTLEEGTFGHPELPWEVAGLRGGLQFEGDRILLQDVRGNLGERPFSVTGTLPFAALAGRVEGQPVELEFDLQELPLGPVLERTEALGEFVTGGIVTGTGSIRGRGLDWRTYRADLHLRELTLRMSRYEIGLASPTRLTLDDGLLQIPSTTFRGAGSDFRVEGTAELARRRLDLNVRGEVDLDPLNTLSEEWGVAGAAAVDLWIRGPVPDLLYEGTVEIRQGLLSPPALNQPIDNIRARLRADGRRLVIEELTGELGGGELTADGEMLLREGRPRSFRINLQVNEGLIRLERQVRLTATGELTYEGTVEQSLLTGTINVDEGVYGRQWSPGEPLLEAMAGPEVENPVLDTVRLDLRLVVPRDLRIDNDLARMEMRADLEVRGTLENPVLLGRAEALEGEFFWQGNTYRVLRGVVEFNNPLETEPLFDVRAETTMRQYTITLNFSGSFDKGVQFSYSSNPPLSDLDLIGLLALGRDPDQVRGGETSLGTSVGLQATRYLTAEYFAEVERGAQRVFGIDRFRIEPSLQGQRADPTARLTVGEQITRNLFVTYSTLLGTSEEQLVTVEYQLTRDIRITGIREEDGSLGLDFHFDFRF